MLSAGECIVGRICNRDHPFLQFLQSMGTVDAGDYGGAPEKEVRIVDCGITDMPLRPPRTFAQRS